MIWDPWSSGTGTACIIISFRVDRPERCQDFRVILEFFQSFNVSHWAIHDSRAHTVIYKKKQVKLVYCYWQHAIWFKRTREAPTSLGLCAIVRGSRETSLCMCCKVFVLKKMPKLSLNHPKALELLKVVWASKMYAHNMCLPKTPTKRAFAISAGGSGRKDVLQRDPPISGYLVFS